MLINKQVQNLVNAFGADTHKQAIKKETLSIDTVPAQAAVSTETTEKAETTAKAETTEKAEGPLYAVQICASKTPLDPSDPKLKGQACEFIRAGEWYKYYSAADSDRAKVQEAMKGLKELFPDCWVITVR